MPVNDQKAALIVEGQQIWITPRIDIRLSGRIVVVHVIKGSVIDVPVFASTTLFHSPSQQQRNLPRKVHSLCQAFSDGGAIFPVEWSCQNRRM
jgi:hypothetical protein